MTDPTAKPASLVTFLLDRSSSMLSGKGATIEGFNGYLAGLQAEKDAKIDFTFLQFDSISLDKVCVAIPVVDAKPLTDETYQPRGGTPLIRAAIQTIQAVAASLLARDDKPKVVICIQTDGEENESGREFTWTSLQNLVAAKQAEGWEFNFLGAGIDAYQQGARMGISALNTMSYDRTQAHTVKEAFSASAANTAGFAAGRVGSTAYSNAQRGAAGDRFAPPDLTAAVAATGAQKSGLLTDLRPKLQTGVFNLDLTH